MPINWTELYEIETGYVQEAFGMERLGDDGGKFLLGMFGTEE